MGELILFRLQPSRSFRSDHPPSAEAEILFFTGVRYSRMIDPPTLADESGDPTPAEGLSGARRGRKRRRG